MNRLDDTTAIPHVLDAILSTERLRLRPATAEDTDATWSSRRLETVDEWLTGWPADLGGYRDLFNEPGRLATTVIVELSDGTIIGGFMLRRESAWAQLEVAAQAAGTQAELGWVLDPAYGGRGYATEAVHSMPRHCFTDPGVRRVVANCFNR